MNKIGLWQIYDGKLERVQESKLELEKYLEEWIEEDPTLIRSGLTIVGKQISLEGGRLDLLAIDPQGCWTIIEIKKGLLHRETIAQVVDYASCIATMPGDELREKIEPYLKKNGLELDTILEQREAAFALEPEKRELELVIVGIGRAPGIDRITQFLADRYNLPITVVDFDVFVLDDQKQILSREIKEIEISETPRLRTPKTTIESVLGLAHQYGTLETMQKCIDVAEQFDLYPRPWPGCIMFAPPSNRTRALFTIWVKPENGKTKIWVGNKPFSEFYPISEENVKNHIGPEGFQYRSVTEMENFFQGLKSLFQEMKNGDCDDLE